MKKELFCLAFVLATTTTNLTFAQVGQVGINTMDPQGVFHFDGKNDTKGVSNTSDDVVVDYDGNLGIGTTRPEVSVHVEGKSKTAGNLQTGSLSLENQSKSLIMGKVGLAGYEPDSLGASLQIVSPTATIKIEDETGGFSPNQYLTSDSLGNAYWSYLRPTYQLAGFDITTGVPQKLYNTAGKRLDMGASSSFVDITDNPLILDKGKWLILCKFISIGERNGAGMLLWVTLRSKSTSLAIPTGGTFLSASTEVVRYGFRPETAGSIYTSPSFTYIVDVPETTEYRVFSLIGTSVAKFYTSDAHNGSMFTAIRLSE